MFDDILEVFEDWLEPVSDTIQDWFEPNSDKSSDQSESLPEIEPIISETPQFDWSTSEPNSDLYLPDTSGSPTEDADYWRPQVSPTSCAVVSQAGIYEAITGNSLSEETACRIALENGIWDPEIGTHPEDLGKFLEIFGISTEYFENATLQDLVNALEEGDKVLVGLDASEIWNPVRNPETGAPLEQLNMGHAVWVTGISTKIDGTIEVTLNDSGTPNGQMMSIMGEDFLNAWEDFGRLMVIADVPVEQVVPA